MKIRGVFGSILVAAVAVALGAAGYVVFMQRGASNTNGNGKNVNGSSNPSKVADVVQQPDADRDGLTDDDETALGTDVDKVDTDGDGLSDSQETKVYKSDPKRLDSDGDGAGDGAEVATGTNPNGEGQLLDVRSAIDDMNAP